MLKLKRAFCIVLICHLLFISIILPASATDNVFPPGLIISDDSGIYVNDKGEYYIEQTDLRPGDTIHKTVTIRNDQEDTFQLFLSAMPISETGPVVLLDELTLKLSIDGKSVYSGRLRGDEDSNMLAKEISLGSCPFGETRTLEIDIVFDSTIPISMFYADNEAKIEWTFSAVMKPDTKDTPSMGDVLKISTYIVLGALSLGTILLLAKKRAKSSSN